VPAQEETSRVHEAWTAERSFLQVPAGVMKRPCYNEPSTPEKGVKKGCRVES
jgi:hypothetical protein